MNDRHRDTGMTMVELVVAVAISALVLTAVAGVFFSAISAGMFVQTGSSTANHAQVAADAISDRVTNGSDAQLFGGPERGDQLLVVRSAGTGSTLTWHCHGWFYRASDGALLSTERATGTPFIQAPTGASPSGWSLIASSLQPKYERGIFDLAGREVRIGFDIVEGESSARIETGAVLRNASAADQGAREQCF